MLWLPATKVRSLESLKSLTSLQRLYLWNTEVSDLEPLTALTSLQVLDLSRTRVSDEEAAELQKALPKVRIYR